MENSFCCDIKCTSSSICSINPIYDSLSMCVLIMIHLTVSVTKGIPELPHSKVWLSCVQVVFDIATPKSSDKIKSPSIITYFSSAYPSNVTSVQFIILCNHIFCTLPHVRMNISQKRKKIKNIIFSKPYSLV